MAQTVAPVDPQAVLETQVTRALIDVREPGEDNSGHAQRASSVPRRQLECRRRRLVPLLGTTVVIYDDGCLSRATARSIAPVASVRLPTARPVTSPEHGILAPVITARRPWTA
jgi:hypothetical protein